MATQTELLARVLDAPDDVHQRQVYADWLSERGDPRGELILLQLEKRNRALTAEEEARESELLELHGKTWIGRLARITQYLEFDAGFLHACAVREIPGWAPRERAWRTVRHLGVQRDARRLPELLQSEHLADLRSLRVADDFLDVAITWAPERLEVLTVDGGRGSVLGALTSTRLRRLRRLELRAVSGRFDLSREDGDWTLVVRLKGDRRGRVHRVALPASLMGLPEGLVTVATVEPDVHRADVVRGLSRSQPGQP